MTKAIRWTPEQLAQYERRLRNPAPAVTASEMAQEARPLSPVERFQALGRLPKGQMNKTEASYAALLDIKKHMGEIKDYRFHPMRIRLANRTYYEVDFLVMAANGELQIHETKGGFTTEKGQMKIKLCAEIMPFFRFYKCIKQRNKDGGGWKIEEYNK